MYFVYIILMLCDTGNDIFRVNIYSVLLISFKNFKNNIYYSCNYNILLV